jgi:hypothetical protein
MVTGWPQEPSVGGTRSTGSQPAIFFCSDSQYGADCMITTVGAQPGASRAARTPARPGDGG